MTGATRRRCSLKKAAPLTGYWRGYKLFRLLALCLVLGIVQSFSNSLEVKSSSRSRSPSRISPRMASTSSASASSNPKQSASPSTNKQASVQKQRSSKQSTSTSKQASVQKQRSLIRGNNPLVSLNLNLDSLAKQGAGTRAQELLERIQALHEEGYYAVAPDRISYNSVLNAWARSSAEDSIERVFEVFKNMQVVTPNRVSFNTLLLALAKHGYPEQAQELLDYMKNLSEDSSSHLDLYPDTISYNSVLYAWSQREDGGALQAEQVLREMVHLTHECLNPHVKPDTISFNTVLNAWANTQQQQSHSPSIHPAKRAEDLLQHMEQLHQAGNDDVEPDVYSYTSVIKAWANSRDADACERAKALLEQMERISVDQKRPHLQPNQVTYSCVLAVFCENKRAREAQELLEHLLEKYEETGDIRYRPDTRTFSAVIKGWSRDDSEDAASQALQLLQTMKRLASQERYEGVVAPNAVTYTSVLKALARSTSDRKTSVDTADALLKEMQSDTTIYVSTIHYNAVLDVYARSSQWDKAQRAKQLLHRMPVTPDVITYNSVLSACANSFGWDSTKRKALSIALETYQLVLEHAEPTPITYFLVFKAIRKLVPPSEKRWSVMRKAFRRCCESGLVKGHVLSQVKLGCTEEQLKELLYPDGADVKRKVELADLSEDWTCNAHVR